MNKEILETYHRQNRIQKEINEIINLFRKPNKETIKILNNKGIEVYTPKRDKVKVGIAIVLIGLCLVTPFTNFFIYNILKWGLK